MKKTNQDRKQTDTNSSKGLKLPLIQSNVQRGKLKEPQSNSSRGKIISKETNQKNNLKEVPKMPNIPFTKSIPRNIQSFVSSNSNQSKNKPRGSSDLKQKNLNINDIDELNSQTEVEAMPKYTEEKLSQLKEQRKQRMKQEKKEEEKQIKLYEKLVEEYKSNTKSKKSNNKNENNEEDPKIIISSKKAQKILEDGGMLDAYKHVLSQLCKHGLPSGNIFEYASYVVKNYEKKWKEKKSQMMKDKIDKYYEEKQKEINQSLETDGEIKIVNKSLEHREELKFIQSLDKSRSGRNVIPKISNTSPRFSNSSNFGKNYINSNIKQEKDENSINEKYNNSPRKLKENSAEQNKKANKKIK